MEKDRQPALSPPPRKERRAHPRATTSGTAHLGLGGGKLSARVRDVSRAGVCFFVERAIPVMTLLDVSLELPRPGGNGGNAAPRLLRGKGAVVRCERISPTLEHYEVAVFLHELDERARAELDEFVLRVQAHPKGF